MVVPEVDGTDFFFFLKGWVGGLKGDFLNVLLPVLTPGHTSIL